MNGKRKIAIRLKQNQPAKNCVHRTSSMILTYQPLLRVNELNLQALLRINLAVFISIHELYGFTSRQQCKKQDLRGKNRRGSIKCFCQVRIF